MLHTPDPADVNTRARRSIDQSTEAWRRYCRTAWVIDHPFEVSPAVLELHWHLYDKSSHRGLAL